MYKRQVYNLILETAGNEKEITIGIGMPGSLHPKTGLVQVSNTKALEGQNVKKDLEEKLGLEVKIANDADCLALSEAIDGAGKDFNSVFAVILGTGVGAGYVVNKQLVVGPNKLTGEWGQNPIPGPMDEYEESIAIEKDSIIELKDVVKNLIDEYNQSLRLLKRI